MREVTFDKALKFKNSDIIIESDYLKRFVTKVKRTDSLKHIRRHEDFAKLENVADGVPMAMCRANAIIHSFIDDISYIDMMSKAKFYVIDTY